jgi:hypothetical protein
MEGQAATAAQALSSCLFTRINEAISMFPRLHLSVHKHQETRDSNKDNRFHNNLNSNLLSYSRHPRFK